MDAEKKVAEILLDIKSVALSPKKPFRYASGILSPIYCDNRLLISHPDKREKIIEYFIKAIKDNKLEFDTVAGVATAGIPHAAWIADRLKKPMIYIRSKAKDHGKQNQIEGVLEPGMKALIIEDLISTGGSTNEAVQAVREAGGVVTDCVAIFTYQMQKSIDRFKESKCRPITLSNFSALVEVAKEKKYITPKEMDDILQWNKDPENWGKKMGFE